MYNFEEIKKVLEPYKNYVEGGVYSCVGDAPADQFKTVYDKDGVLILHNTYLNYMDVIGLSEEHIKEVANMVSFDYEAEQARQEVEWQEYSLIHDAEPIIQTISIMTGYFMGDINETELVDLLMSISNDNKYVKERILNIITDEK